MFFTSLDSCQKSRGYDAILPIQNSSTAWINHTAHYIYSSMEQNLTFVTLSDKVFLNFRSDRFGSMQL